MRLPSNPQTFFLGGLFALGTLTAIYVVRSIILSVVLAFVLKLLLQSAVRVLERVNYPGDDISVRNWTVVDLCFVSFD
jgi:predicted PurR-regulated permease PerM